MPAKIAFVFRWLCILRPGGAHGRADAPAIRSPGIMPGALHRARASCNASDSERLHRKTPDGFPRNTPRKPHDAPGGFAFCTPAALISCISQCLRLAHIWRRRPHPRLLRKLCPPSTMVQLPLAFAWTVFFQATAASLLTAVAFIPAPALCSRAPDLHGTLKSGARSVTSGHDHQRLRHVSMVGRFSAGDGTARQFDVPPADRRRKLRTGEDQG